MNEKVFDKLKILANSAKYDVSCSSSGSNRTNKGKGIGNAAPWGICHSFTEDGRCVSLLKIMLTNHCMFDCAYCVNRRTNNIERTALTAEEIVDLTIGFYRRNYIEGLFLSSGVFKSPDHTMEQMVRVAKDLRTIHNYNGYIHLKAIPGASPTLLHEAGLWADRLSVNIEIPSEPNLTYLAPEKNYKSILQPMSFIASGILENKEDKIKHRNTPKFTPAGQSTQLIVGATPDTDMQILGLSSMLYQQQQLKRVYYSGYIAINTTDKRLPALVETPLVRENRLYQADWLMRFYQFKADEILDSAHPNLDLELDPKLAWALRNPWLYPVDLQTASYETILRVPGIGVRSAQLIVSARTFGTLNSQQLRKMGVVLKRAQYFMTLHELRSLSVNELSPQYLRKQFVSPGKTTKKVGMGQQLQLFNDSHFV